MKSLLTSNSARAAVVVLMILLAGPSLCQSNLPASAQNASVRRSSSATVETVQFHSALIGKTLPYNVVLPPDYRVARASRYPVLYLLHGVGGHYSDWTTKTNVADYASRYRMIVVTPEANDSWYTDSTSIPSDKYESYIMKELIADVQHRYRMIETRYGRGIAGLSMGGYGALKFGLKFSASFIFAGSISGALGATSWTERDFPGPIRDSVLSVFGAPGSEARKANDIFAILRSMNAGRVASLPYFYLDCGTEDPFFSYSPEFAAILREKKVPHEYRQLPGNHNWAYWDQQVAEVVKVAAEKLHALPRTARRR